jgi:hypothetical protein
MAGGCHTAGERPYFNRGTTPIKKGIVRLGHMQEAHRHTKMDPLMVLRGNFQIFVRHGFTGCGKIPKVSFRGRGLPEESAFFLGLAKKQIPRFARDDKINYFSQPL